MLFRECDLFDKCVSKDSGACAYCKRHIEYLKQSESRSKQKPGKQPGKQPGRQRCKECKHLISWNCDGRPYMCEVTKHARYYTSKPICKHFESKN